MLLSIYPLALIPFIIVIFVKDILHKKEGIMVWHRDSFGLLVQRFFFTLLIMSSILTFIECIDTDKSEELKSCFIHTGIPLIFVLVFVAIKVICLRSQRIFLWSGFTICLIVQFIVLKSVNVELLVDIAS